MRADRLLSIVALLRRHQRLSAGELARRLEVDRRTVLRDIEALSTAGYGIYAERGRNGGFALLPEYRPDVGGLTAEQTRALFLAGGQPALERLGLAEPLAQAMTKISVGLPDDQQQQVERLEQRIVIDSGGWLAGPDPLPQLEIVERAVLTDRRLRFHYQPRPDRRPGTRTVDPYGLVQAAGTWYLIAAHRGRPRSYRLSRMSAVRALQQDSQRPGGLDLRTLWAQLQAEYASGVAGQTIRLRTSPAFVDFVCRALAVQLLEPPTITAQEDEMIIEAQVSGLRGTIAVLAGFGSKITIDTPPELIDGVLEVADQLRQQYGS